MQRWQGRMLNIHTFRLLPKYKGLDYASPAPSEAGDSHAGVSVHLVTAGNLEYRARVLGRRPRDRHQRPANTGPAKPCPERVRF